MISIVWPISSYPAGAKTAVYVSNQHDGEIAAFLLDSVSGELEYIGKTKAGDSVMALAVNPQHTRLYASLRAEPFSVVNFTIEESGKLASLSTTAIDHDACYVSLDRRGKYFLSASYYGSKVAVNKIGETGAVSANHMQVLDTGIKAHAIRLDASNRFALVTNLGSDQILQYVFDENTGRLSPNNPAVVKTDAGAGPRHLVFSPDNKIVYVLNELDGTVNIYRMDQQKGTLMELQSVSILPKDFSGKIWAAEIKITHNGRYLYTSERTSSTITAFQIEAKTGKLSYLYNMPTEKQPRAIDLSPDSQFVFVAGQLSGYLSVYKISEQTGGLTFLNRYEVGNSPSWIEVIEL